MSGIFFAFNRQMRYNVKYTAILKQNGGVYVAKENRKSYCYWNMGTAVYSIYSFGTNHGRQYYWA